MRGTIDRYHQPQRPRPPPDHRPDIYNPTTHPGCEENFDLCEVGHPAPGFKMAAAKMTKNQMRRAKKKEQKKTQTEARRFLLFYSLIHANLKLQNGTKATPEAPESAAEEA